MIANTLLEKFTGHKAQRHLLGTMEVLFQFLSFSARRDLILP